MPRKPVIPELSAIDLADYAAISKYVPEAKPKQVKWLKEMLDMARTMPEKFNVDKLLKGMEDIDPPFRLQCLAGMKSAIALAKLEKTKPTQHEQTGQLELFHPEAFQGGENQDMGVDRVILEQRWKI